MTVPIIVRGLAIGALTVMIRCAFPTMSDSGANTPQTPPFPRTESILPMAQGNSWSYSYTSYDSSGRMITPNRLVLDYMISAQFGMPDDTTLITITMRNYTQKFRTYAYLYTAEERDSGYLLVYRDLYPLGKRGVYIIGYHNGAENRVYDKEQLWLAYPADSGFSWSLCLTTNDTIYMDIVSSNTMCTIVDATTMAGIRSLNSCYLYRERSGARTSYYYYHPRYGALAYLSYRNGTLRETYLLKSFTNQFDRTIP